VAAWLCKNVDVNEPKHVRLLLGLVRVTEKLYDWGREPVQESVVAVMHFVQEDSPEERTERFDPRDTRPAGEAKTLHADLSTDCRAHARERECQMNGSSV
jgi:hypothetical protein